MYEAKEITTQVLKTILIDLYNWLENEEADKKLEEKSK